MLLCALAHGACWFGLGSASGEICIALGMCGIAMLSCACYMCVFVPAAAICRLVFATVSAARIRVRSDADASATCGHESLNCRTVQEALAIASLDGTEIDVISPSVRASSDASDARSLQICDFRALLLEVSKD